jgi:prepilin-type N-terminal cleavage/methylation domain-containing protein
MATPSARRGFTLVELLMVIAIIAILIALLFPAVQGVREAARQAQCSNNVKQLALGLLAYHTTNERFPAGQPSPIVGYVHTFWDRSSWFYRVLPHLEQQALADAYLGHLLTPTTSPLRGSWSFQHMPNKEAVVPGMLCPSQGLVKVTCGAPAGNQQGFHANYVLNAGNSFFNAAGSNSGQFLNGLFFVDSNISLAHVRDGTSNTLLASELVLVEDGPVGLPINDQDMRGRLHNVRHTGGLFSTLYPPNTSQPDRHAYCIDTKVAPCTDNGGTNTVVSARSLHRGGVVAALADGSVRFISDQINLIPYAALGSRAGGEAVQTDF